MRVRRASNHVHVRAAREKMLRCAATTSTPAPAPAPAPALPPGHSLLQMGVRERKGGRVRKQPKTGSICARCLFAHAQRRGMRACVHAFTGNSLTRPAVAREREPCMLAFKGALRAQVPCPKKQAAASARAKRCKAARQLFITASKGGVARANGVEEKEKECTTAPTAIG